MDIHRYGGRYLDSTLRLKERGLLLRGELPTQKVQYFVATQGVDIIYRFQRMDHDHLAKNAPRLLRLVIEEGSRYEDIPDSTKHVKIYVDIYKPGKKKPLERTYPTAEHHSTEIMVYGPGYETPGFEYFLSDVLDHILDIPKRYGTATKDASFKVKKMEICIRVKKEVFKKEKLPV